MTTAARNTNNATGMQTPAAVGKIMKKQRKPYTISRPREKWTGEEHERFLHALLLFGRDWKTIEQLVGTKTATQIRSHAQKYFLKVHKLGLAAALPAPAHHPRRAAVLPRPLLSSQTAAGASVTWTAASSRTTSTAGAGAAAAAASWPGHHDDDPFTTTTPNSGGSRSDEASWLLADRLLQDDDAAVQQQLPLSPDDLRFAEVYRFVGDVFGSGASRPVEAQLQRLHGADPVVAEMILLVLRNLQDNLCLGV